MRVLGIDPGIASLGFGLVESTSDGLVAIEHGAITTQARTPLPDRLHRLYWSLMDIISQHRPTEVAIEEVFPARKLLTAMLIGQARGIAILAAANHRLPVYEYAPSRVKQLVAGYGRGRKDQIQEMVRLQLGLAVVPRPDDAADALAIAICHIRASSIDRLLQGG